MIQSFWHFSVPLKASKILSRRKDRKQYFFKRFSCWLKRGSSQNTSKSFALTFWLESYGCVSFLFNNLQLTLWFLWCNLTRKATYMRNWSSTRSRFRGQQQFLMKMKSCGSSPKKMEWSKWNSSTTSISAWNLSQTNFLLKQLRITSLKRSCASLEKSITFYTTKEPRKKTKIFQINK